MKNLGKSLFWISVILSGFVGIKITSMFSYQILMAAPFLSDCWPLSLIVLKMIFASISFFVLYRVLAFSIIAGVERKHGLEICRPSAVRGMIYSALIPFILGVLGLALIFFIVATTSSCSSVVFVRFSDFRASGQIPRCATWEHILLVPSLSFFFARHSPPSARSIRSTSRSSSKHSGHIWRSCRCRRSRK